jgi:hypothetical protein
VRIKSQKDFWSGLMVVVTGVDFALGAFDHSFGRSARVALTRAIPLWPALSTHAV